MSCTSDSMEKRVERFVRLLASVEHRLASYVLALVPNWSDAEEVIQETKVRLWEQFDDYDPKLDFGAWACTIAHYQVLTVRNKRKLLSGMSAEFLDRVSVEFERAYDHISARRQALGDCLRKCSDRKRALVERYYAGQETIEQIALQLGRKADAVRQELVRVRRALYDCIEQKLGQGGSR